MKKLSISLVLLTSVVYLAGCSTTNTQVRLLTLSYELPGVQSQAARANDRAFLDKKNANEEEYVFPGDLLTFTVELEDPDFEFVSLLAIKFNGVTIRGNTDDSIVDTRDCGANICLDFPFEVSADVTEYTVEEIKFAKLNGDSGINAVIDDQSQKILNILSYTEPNSPYVENAVSILNQMVNDVSYLDTNSPSMPIDEWVQFIEEGDLLRRHYVINLPINETYSFFTNGLGQVMTPTTNQEEFLSNNITHIDGSGIGQGLSVNNYSIEIMGDNSASTGIFLNVLIINFSLYEEKYSSSNFYREGNDVFVNILGDDFYLFSMEKRMKLLTTEEFRSLATV
jgi:hypothetical protein